MSAPRTSGESAAEIFGSDRMWGLKELPLPEPVSWWPQTAGWAVLGVILGLGLIALAWRLLRRHRRNAYRRKALARLDAMTGDAHALVQLPVLLRKAALVAGGRAEVASLRGHDWIAWLNARAGRELFTDADAAALDRLAYAPPAAVPLAEADAYRLVTASKAWMRCHRAAV